MSDLAEQIPDVASLLGEHHININYAYCTGGAPGGRTTGIFKVADPKKAMHVLKEKGGKHKEAGGIRKVGRK